MCLCMCVTERDGGGGGFLPPPSNCPTPPGCSTVQLNFDTVFLEIASDPTGSWLSPAGMTPPPSDASCSPVAP